MSNSHRIWIMYALIAAMLAMFLGSPLIAGLLGASDDVIGINAATGGLTGFIAWMIFSQSSLARCWRCNQPISRNGVLHWPIVWWTRCSNCGVRHSATPDEVRANPMAHLKPGKR